MTALTLQTAALAYGLVVLAAARRPLPGAPLWTLPPLPPVPERVFEYTGGAGDGWSPLAEVTAAAKDDDASILAGGAYLPMTTGELLAIVTADHADVAAELDAVEAALHAELDWVVASALLWLGADLETEHTLVSLAGYAGDCALREEVLANA